MSGSPSITVTPPSCLMDEPVRVKIVGLAPSSLYTLRTTAYDCKKDIPFFTIATYKSDDAGEIDLTKTPSLGGHFRGVHSMGPFAHLTAERRQNLYEKFEFSGSGDIVKYLLEVYTGAVAGRLATANAEKSALQMQQKDDAQELQPLCSVAHERRLLAEDCTRIPVRHGRARGCLFLPPGKGPFPGLVDIQGYGGGLKEHRAAMLASRGFAVLALAYYKYEDLPENYYITYEIAYFNDAVQYLLSREEVRKVGVGVIGISKGGDFALNMAISIPEVKAAVTINSGIMSSGTPTRLLDGTERPIVSPDMSKLMLHPGGVMELYYASPDPRDHPDSVFHIEEARGDILWICSLGDKSGQISDHADLAVERCQKAGVPDKVKVLKYPGAGHIIEPPYYPIKTITNTMYIDWGGTPVEHIAAQEQSWKEIIAFFNEKLQ